MPAADVLGPDCGADAHAFVKTDARTDDGDARADAGSLRKSDARALVTTDNRSALVEADGFTTAVDALTRSAVTGPVRLGCDEEVAATALADVASRFDRTHPDVTLTIRVHDSARVAAWLAAGEIDVALLQVLDTAGAVFADDEVWRRDDLSVVQARHADFDGSADVPLVSFGPRCLYEPWFGAAMETAGRRWHQVVECPSIQGVQAAVEAGLGVAVLNTPNVTTAMRPWTGADLGPPSVAFVLRRGVAPGTVDAVDALCAHLAATLEERPA